MGLKLSKKGFRWGIKGKFLKVKLGRFWRSSWAARGRGTWRPLQAFKNRLAEHCSDLTEFISSCCEAQAWHSSPPELPSEILCQVAKLPKMFLLAFTWNILCSCPSHCLHIFIVAHKEVYQISETLFFSTLFNH